VTALDLNRATQIKALIESSSIRSVILYAQGAYPGECCGFVLESGAVFPARNVIESLYDNSLTTKNAFLIDDESWKIASNGASPIICIYHSHTNGDSNMSEADRLTLRWSGLFYMIIGLIDRNPISAKIFWWESDDLKELVIQL